ncbi:hypothetical protein Cgig2_010035 [Carnegiea gigantea]|uniref:Uncharacterized protein n=1 Tax=Carnegiea gigantea TaxID=171969 RepID=A0A9Q1GQC9_9CARY|nr:hypothetical protein Cgig2_010035 [Carnegiea gigantea]
MNYCAIQCNGVAPREEMRSFVAIGERRESVVCPKPRRVGLLNTSFNDPSRSLRWQLGHQAELDSRGGSELLDIILSKGGHDVDRPSSQIASPPPFFCGSPPSRVANPLVQDARFREEKQLIPPFSPVPPAPVAPASGSASSPNSSSRKGGRVRANFGSNAAVRIEGFDCLDRDRRNCSIPALA